MKIKVLQGKNKYKLSEYQVSNFYLLAQFKKFFFQMVRFFFVTRKFSFPEKRKFSAFIFGHLQQTNLWQLFVCYTLHREYTKFTYSALFELEDNLVLLASGVAW